MNKSELITHIAKKNQASKADIEYTLNEILNQIVLAVKSGETVTFANFGSFVPRTKPARKGRNPKTGEEMDIPEKQTVKFKPYKAFNLND